ncbi:MarR family winged helix-turn-helix transcriptional regulator [Amycolatopsis thermoflava]|uniref:MarR family winged helix-turn-helix transcriptional regulator n=1 Tax=Amycolatopsis thermoflava TaxID=84480 RepID=UPI0036549E7D
MVDAGIDRDVCKLVHEFARRLDVHVRRVGEEVGLTPTQVVALRELSEPITARELASRMACEASNATFVIDRLEEQGLVQRRPHPTDRRAKELVLTAAGRDARAGVLDRLDRASPLISLGREQQETLVELLRELVGPQGR